MIGRVEVGLRLDFLLVIMKTSAASYTTGDLLLAVSCLLF